jgi:hypothetical protein
VQDVPVAECLNFLGSVPKRLGTVDYLAFLPALDLDKVRERPDTYLAHRES